MDGVLISSHLDEAYHARLRAVLEAAQASERASVPITLLPLLSCQAVCNAPDPAIPVAAAWRALLIAAKLLDDVEDGDIYYMSAAPTAPPEVINLSTGFFAIAGLALAKLPSSVALDLQADFNQTILIAASGQHADLSKRADLGLEQYFEIMAAKSGVCFALAGRAGARCVTTDATAINRYDQFGYNVGLVIQLINDLMGLRLPGAQGDLAAGRHTLPVRYAFAVASSGERARLSDALSKAGTDGEAERQARHLITALGAEVYLMAEMARFRRRALAAFEDIDPAAPSIQPLLQWLRMVQASITSIHSKARTGSI